MLSSIVFVAISTTATLVNGHGYLAEPASRNAMYKFGFANPANYDHMGLNAGGPSVVSKYGATPCGDSILGPQEHMAGGKYGNGIISKTYVEGSIIDITVAITAHHKGHFNFKLCDVSSSSGVVTQDCLDQTELKRADGKGKKWLLPAPSAETSYTTKYVLPSGFSCEHCVLQWHWTTANSPGAYPEEFWNCADIAIFSKKTASLVQMEQRQKEAFAEPVVLTNTVQALEEKAAEVVEDILSPTTNTVPVAAPKKCVSLVAHVSNKWCQEVGCNQVYAAFCQLQ